MYERPFNPSYGLVVHRDMLIEKDIIAGVLAIHEHASNLIKAKPDQAALMTASALPGLTDPFIQKVYSLSPKYCASLPEDYMRATEKFIPVMKSLGYLKDFKKSEKIFETRFIEKVHPGPHHY